MCLLKSPGWEGAGRCSFWFVDLDVSFSVVSSHALSSREDGENHDNYNRLQQVFEVKKDGRAQRPSFGTWSTRRHRIQCFISSLLVVCASLSVFCCFRVKALACSNLGGFFPSGAKQQTPTRPRPAKSSGGLRINIWTLSRQAGRQVGSQITQESKRTQHPQSITVTKDPGAHQPCLGTDYSTPNTSDTCHPR